MTPMMQQYFEIKNKYRDFILFYRLGDFYEMFFEDAQIVSAELELTLTGRDCGEDERAPMCGVPYHSCEPYIGKLIEKGYKVAICEQVEDPKSAKNLVRREVIRVITPGTLIETDLLNDKANNYLSTLYFDGDSVGLCFADISTAYIATTAIHDFRMRGVAEDAVVNELATYKAREILMNTSVKSLPRVADYIKNRTDALLTDGASNFFDTDEAVAQAENLFTAEITSGIPRAALIATGAALKYIYVTQMKDLSYIKNLNYYESSQFLEMDTSTRRSLELCETMNSGEKKGSLLWVLDKTETSMGARMLRQMIEHPLTNASQIYMRQQAVGELCENFMLREELRDKLSSVLDLERLITKVTYGTAGGRDLRAIAQTASVLPEIKALLSDITSGELSEIHRTLDTLEDICRAIDEAIEENPPFVIRDGGIIRDGYHEEVDHLRYIMKNGKDWIHEAEASEREKTGIRGLKIGYNRVFGYYIEVTKSFLDRVPDRYIRKQTLTNCERYITEELKEMEARVLGAKDKVVALEYELFQQIREFIADNVTRIQKTASALARLDVFASLAEVAKKRHYVCPEVDYSDKIQIIDGRHPIVESVCQNGMFVPNDVDLSTQNRLMLITGPNMAGKSTYMRQTALIILMAQMGSFVPAREARIGIVDKLFTRVGASDDLASGQSTFMLEMNEVAYILKNATAKSFIVYDEIGRGTSTFDGMSIARAVAEYTAGKKVGAKTMFATHYHELCELEDTCAGVVNYNIAAKKRGDELIFLRKIVRGAADDSYGIEVAKLAGVPNEVTKRASAILENLIEGAPVPLVKGAAKSTSKKETPTAVSFDDLSKEQVVEKLKALDINTLTPIEALTKLYELKNLLD